MPDYGPLQQRLDRGEVVVLDGAVGTELQAMGVPMDDEAWCGLAMDTHPDTVRRLHERYIRAGADVITTNTFSTGRHALEAAGRGDKVAEWNGRAVSLAREARDRVAGDRPVFVAGSVAPFGARPDLGAKQLRANFEEQVSVLAESGADLLLLEMLGSTVERVGYAAEAAAGTGLPAWLAVSCFVEDATGDAVLGIRESTQSPGRRSHDGTFSDAVQAMRGVPASALLVFHSQVEAAEPALRAMLEHWNGPVGAYPHSGYWRRPDWQFVNVIAPQDYLAHARRWAQMGAQIVGGCCGTAPDHVAALREGLPATAGPRATR